MDMSDDDKEERLIRHSIFLFAIFLPDKFLPYLEHRGGLAA